MIGVILTTASHPLTALPRSMLDDIAETQISYPYRNKEVYIKHLTIEKRKTICG